MKNSLKKLLLLVMVGGSFGVAACNNEPPPPPKAKAKASTASSNAAPTQVTSATVVTAPTEYTYDTSLRDPFQPAKIITSESSGESECGPLCQFDTSQFHVKGIIWGISQPTAMLSAPDGNPYIVKMGASIGKNKGKVVSITKDRIAVLEKYVNYRGEVVTNRVDIELQEGARK
jgi:Tfp pilus assembly protein PilP